MPVPLVVVEIQAEDRRPDLIRILLDACTRAALDRECISEEAEAGDPIRAHAVVDFSDPDHARLRVRVGDASPVERTLDFRKEDAVAARWQSVGLIVGTLASREDGEPPVETPTGFPAPTRDEQDVLREPSPEPENAAVPATGEPASPAPPPTEARMPGPPPFRGWFDGGAALGPSLGMLRVGPELGGALLVFENVFATSRIGYLWSAGGSEPFDAVWLVASIGAGYALSSASWTFTPRVEAVAQWLDVSPRDEGLQTASRWLFGARITADAAFYPSVPLGIYAAVNGTWLSKETELRAGEDVLASESVFGYGCATGLRLRL